MDNSRLIAELYENRSKTVPVGKTILVNNSQHMKNYMPQTAGKPLTSLHMDQFDVFGRERDQKRAGRNVSLNDVDFEDRETENGLQVLESSFDQVEGQLKFVRHNGELLIIDDLFVQSDFGRGATGPRGDRGPDGADGFDGNEGSDGIRGCAGDDGPLGLEGEPGEPGEDGAQGIRGPIGQEGRTGNPGPPGEQGRIGHEGPRGIRGLVCEPERGGAGPAGDAPDPYVVISSSPPKDSLIWGVPEA